MSNTDSFIDEVTEEVRRDRLYGYLRRYGWIGILAVVAIVAGAAWTEYQRQASATRAQAFGDALFSALEAEDPAARVDALQSVEVPESGAPMAALLTAIEAGNGSDAAADALRGLAEDGSVPPIYRDMARMRLAMMTDTVPLDERQALVAALSAPGQPFATIAAELGALQLIEVGNEAGAIEALQALIRNAAASESQRQRAAQLVVALGGQLNEG